MLYKCFVFIGSGSGCHKKLKIIMSKQSDLYKSVLDWKSSDTLRVINPFFIHYKPRIAVAILDL